MSTISFGRKAEAIAANYLISQGYEILESNFYNKKGYRVGEIDLIAKNEKDGIIFIEVKARRGKMGEVIPEENITSIKIKKIEKAASEYLQKNRLFGTNWRIDSVGIIFDFEKRKMHIRHIKNIRQ